MKQFFLLAAGLVFISIKSSGQVKWESTGGPTGCTVRDFARDSSGLLWAVADFNNGSRFYLSNDDGQTWATKPADFTTAQLIGMEVGPDGALYCFDGLKSIHKSTDGGDTWTTTDVAQVGFGGPFFMANRLVFLDNGNLLFVGHVSLAESQDGGATWSVKTSFNGGQGLSTINIFEKAPNGDLWMGCRSKTNMPFELWRSTDSGLTFETVFSQSGGVSPFNQITFLNGAVIFSGRNGFFRSVDGGQNWLQSHSSIFVEGMAAAPDGNLYASMDTIYGDNNDPDYLKASYNGGADWVQIGNVPDPTGLGGILSATPNGSILLHATNLWRSADGGQNWGMTSPNISNLQVRHLAFNPTSGVLYANANAQGVFKSSDGGQAWQHILSTITGGFNNQTTFYFSGNGHVFLNKGGKLLRSIDDGETWQDITPADFGALGYSVYDFAVSPNGKIFLDANNGTALPFFSPDEGETWSQLPPAPTLNYRVVADDTLQFAGSLWGSGHFRTTDGGYSWTALPQPDPAPGGWDIMHWAAWDELFANYNGQLYRSTDLGENWAKVLTPTGAFFSNPGLYSTEDGRMFIWSNNAGLYFTDDFGLTWATLMDAQYLNGDFTNPGVCLAFREGQPLFIGTNHQSVWRSNQANFNVAKITGRVSKDQNGNCQTDPADLPLQNWLIQATDPDNHTAFATTDQNGNYRLGFLLADTTATELAIEVQQPNHLWQPCDSSTTVTVSPQDDLKTGIDFSVEALLDCPLLEVSASIWPARPCFPTTVGANWCNLGTLPVPDARLFLKMGPLISVDSASMPIAAQHGDTLEFALGDIALNECGLVRVFGQLSCDAVLGQAICVSAKVTPDSICAAFTAWSGATLMASANCVGDSVVDFTIKNIGIATSTNGLEYVVIEDQVLLFTGQVQSLAPGAEMTFAQPADGSTFSLKGEQEPGHPLSNFIFAFAEGCGEPSGMQPDFGWITPFLGEDGDPFSDDFCREATASFDPNLKEGFPKGYGNEHFINQNQPIDYFIQFQNTGTDTAFQVVLRDTISPLMDLSSLRVGAASHPFSYEIYGPGILKFIFKNILLPDSTVNEPASHGWVNFQVSQKKDLPLGTVIRNHVGIYFDFNAPVLTNETWHTLGEDFIILDWKSPSPGSNVSMKTFPNPMAESVEFELQGIDNEEVVIELSVPDGRVVRRMGFSKKPFVMKRGGLPGGIYFFRVSTKSGAAVGEGKLLVR